MTNVVGIHNALPCEREVVPSCVEALEHLLEAARSGEVIGVAVSALHHDAACEYFVAGRAGGYGMIGALEMARARLTEINDGDS